MKAGYHELTEKLKKMSGQGDRKYKQGGGSRTREIGDIAGELQLLALNAMFEGARTGYGGDDFIRVADEAGSLAMQGMDRIQKRRPVKLSK